MLPTLLPSVLGNVRIPSESERNTYAVFLLVIHKRGDGPTSIGTITSLTTDANSSTANAKVIDSAGDGAGRRRH